MSFILVSYFSFCSFSLLISRLKLISHCFISSFFHLLDTDKHKTESANIAADAEYMRSQLWEDMRRELEKELREQIREETRRELETELRESIRAELEEEQAQSETSDEKMPYLIRKKTGEIISLNKQTFIIGT